MLGGDVKAVARTLIVLAAGALSLACGGEREGTLASSRLPAEFRDRSAQGSELWETYSDALVAGDLELLGELLGDEFLIQRTNGSWADKAAFLATLPTLRSFSSSGYVERRGVNVIVLRLDAVGDLSVDGVQYRSVSAPMLVVFEWANGHWVLQAQGNFNLPDA